MVNAIKDYCLTEKEKEENKAGADHKDNSSEERDCEITFLSLTCFCHQTAIQNVISTLQLDCCPHKANGKSPNLTEKELYLAGQPNLDSPEIVLLKSNFFTITFNNIIFFYLFVHSIKQIFGCTVEGTKRACNVPRKDIRSHRRKRTSNH